MKNKNIVFEISLLISKFLSGEISVEENERLEHWKKESPHHSGLFEKICSKKRIAKKFEIYRKDNREEALLAFMVEKRKREQQCQLSGKKIYKQRLRRLCLWGVNIAAVVAIVMGLTKMPVFRNEKENNIVAFRNDTNVRVTKWIAASGQIFNLDTLDQIEGDLTSVQNKNGRLVFSAKNVNAEGDYPLNTIEVPKGAEYELILTDGTKVFLNSGTSFRFPENFSGKGSREVYLSGEAYFKVARDTARPFVVHTDLTYTKVLGTVFNIKAYPNLSVQEITLVQGVVRVGCQKGGGDLELAPGVQASYDKNTGSIEKRQVDVSYYTAWKEGVFAFRECPLDQVLETLGRWYDFEVFFENTSVRDNVYTGKVKRHATLREVLDHFRQTREFDYEIRGRSVIIK